LAECPKFSDYIVFVDESGSPTLDPVDPDYPIFVLVFCVVAKKEYADRIQPSIKHLKFDFFGHDLAVLHSHDIRKPKKDFLFLLDAEQRKLFLGRLDEVVAGAAMNLIVHIIDKPKLIKKYVQPFDPYHIARRMCLVLLSSFWRE
jgi:hypothetical protein